MKYHPHGSVLFVTFSIEQGLLLLCNPLCEAMLKSCFARAQYKYPVRVSGFLVEASHVHFVLVVTNPDDVSSFIRYFKTEIAPHPPGTLYRIPLPNHLTFMALLRML
jgi:REP element-mobilizing transposase RayT